MPGDPAAGGAALRAALAGITDASADNPYLVRIEPGQYDIGSAPLALKDFVDVEGSGEGVTRVVGHVTAAATNLVIVANAELRALTLHLVVDTIDHDVYRNGIQCENKSPVLTHVTIDAAPEPALVVMIQAIRCQLTLQNVTLTGTSTAGAAGHPTGGLYGILTALGSATIDTLHVDLTCNGDYECIGMRSSNAAVDLRRSDVTLGRTTAIPSPLHSAEVGVWFDSTELLFESTDVRVTGAPDPANMVAFTGINRLPHGTMRIVRSTLATDPGGAALSFQTLTDVGTPPAVGVVDVASTQLVGKLTSGGNGTTTWSCIDNYDGDWKPIATCP